MKIMIVDDSEFARDFIGKILTGAGHEVIGGAADGREAVELYGRLKHKPDIVTMDIVMPGLSGTEAIKQIMKLDPSARIVVISSIGHWNKIEEAIGLGAKAYVVKPVEPEKLLAALADVMQREGTVPARVPDYVEILFNAIPETAEKILGLRVGKNHLLVRREPLLNKEVILAGKLTGRAAGYIIIALAQETAIHIASKMNQVTHSKFDQASKSAILEFASMIMGNGVTRLQNKGFDFGLTAPYLLSGDEAGAGAAGKEVYFFPLETPYGRLDISIVLG